MPVDSCMLFLKIARTLSPSTTSRRGPGHIESKPWAAIGSFTASIWCWISSTVNSKTLTSPSSVGSLGWLPAPSTLPYSPSRKRVTTAWAAASWSVASGEPDGAGEWSIDGLADGAVDAAADGTAPEAPGDPAAAGGGVAGPYVHDGLAAAGAHAATVAATNPPPAMAAVRRKPRRE